MHTKSGKNVEGKYAIAEQSYEESLQGFAQRMQKK